MLRACGAISGSGRSSRHRKSADRIQSGFLVGHAKAADQQIMSSVEHERRVDTRYPEFDLIMPRPESGKQEPLLEVSRMPWRETGKIHAWQGPPNEVVAGIVVNFDVHPMSLGNRGAV